MTAIQWSDGSPIYRQLKERVVAMIIDGELKPGDALPSVRTVAAEYQLNPITVSRAFQELADEGLVEKRQFIHCDVSLLFSPWHACKHTHRQMQKTDRPPHPWPPHTLVLSPTFSGHN